MVRDDDDIDGAREPALDHFAFRICLDIACQQDAVRACGYEQDAGRIVADKLCGRFRMQNAKPHAIHNPLEAGPACLCTCPGLACEHPACIDARYERLEAATVIDIVMRDY